MKLIGGVGLTARSLLRAFRAHRLRAVAAIFAGAMCIALTTGVRVVAVSVDDAIEGATISSVARSDLVVQARSADGIGAAAVQAMHGAAPDARLAPVLLADTHVAVSHGSPLLLAGVTPAVAGFLPTSERAALGALGTGASAPAVALSAGWAAEHHLRIGSPLPIETPDGRTLWRVVALVRAGADRTALAVAALPAVARAFRREGVSDMVLVSAPGARARLQATLQRSVGQSASVVTPSQALASYKSSFAPTRNLLDIFVTIAVLAAGAILFFTWRLTLEDAREQLARLRLCGARLSHLAGGATVVLGAIFLCSVLIGAPLGVLLGSSLNGFSRTLVGLTQLAGSPGTPVLAPLGQAIGLSLLIFLFALAVSLRTVRRMTVIEAVVGRRDAGQAGLSRWAPVAVLALIALVLALAALLLLPADRRQAALVPLLVLLGACSILAPLLLGATLRRRRGFAALAAGRELTYGAHRTAILLAVFSLAIAMAIGLQGSATSIKDGIARSARAWTVADMYVQSAESGENLQEDKLAPSVLRRIAAAPGVASVGYFTYSTVEMHRTRIPLWTWGPSARSAAYAHLRSTDGPSGPALWRALGPNTVAVSSNYGRLYGVRRGQTIYVPTVGGAQRGLRVVAIVDDLFTSAGMIVMAPSLYQAVTGDVRVYQAIVDVRAGTPVGAVAAGIRASLGPQFSALTVYDRAQIRKRFDVLTGQLVQAFVVFGDIMFVLALLIGGATLATTMSLRQRSLALTQLVGGSVSLVWWQLVREAVALGVAAWVIAGPVGIAVVYALLSAIAAQSGLLPPVELPVALVAISLPLAILMSVLALLIGSPRRRIPAMSALAEE